MSLYTAPGIEGNWLGSWTIFYWAWWMSWAPFVSIFIARISRGRSIRQTVAATLILPTLADFLWYGVIGGAGERDYYRFSGAASQAFTVTVNAAFNGAVYVRGSAQDFDAWRDG